MYSPGPGFEFPPKKLNLCDFEIKPFPYPFLERDAVCFSSLSSDRYSPGPGNDSLVFLNRSIRHPNAFLSFSPA